MKEVPDSYKRYSEKCCKKLLGWISESVEELPVLDLKFEDFEHCGTVFSTFNATCPRCGTIGKEDHSVFADIRVQEDPENSDDRIITSVIFCQTCDRQTGWGFKVTRDDITRDDKNS